MIVRAFAWKGAATKHSRSHADGFVGGGRYAMEKSVIDVGEEGVIMTAGRGDFSATIGSVSMVRSMGGGMRVKSRRCGRRVREGARGIVE